MNNENNHCLSNYDNTPLATYSLEEEAQKAALYANQAYNKDFITYKCNKCFGWHLSPKNRHTNSHTCKYCTGHDGKNKKTYDTLHSAKMRANIIFEEQCIALKTYKCPYDEGWHLTKK